jgi:hypothetical protein
MNIEDLQRENDRLKYILAKSKEPCIYCKLPADEINKCLSCFPGCARMDDIMVFENYLTNGLEE